MLLEREAFLDTLAGPPGRLILVGGEAGVGKTALVREFAEGRQVLWGACDPLHTPRPLGPLLDVPTPPARAAGGRRRRAAARGLVTALLARLRDRPGTVLVLEDVHWADEGTLDVLRLLGRRMRACPSLAIVTFRDDEPGPLRVVLGELATAMGVERIKLPPLSPRRCARSPSRTGSTPTPCTAAPAATRSTSPRCCPRPPPRSRPRCATPCSPAPPA